MRNGRFHFGAIELGIWMKSLKDKWINLFPLKTCVLETIFFLLFVQILEEMMSSHSGTYTQNFRSSWIIIASGPIGNIGVKYATENDPRHFLNSWVIPACICSWRIPVILICNLKTWVSKWDSMTISTSFFQTQRQANEQQRVFLAPILINNKQPTQQQATQQPTQQPTIEVCAYANNQHELGQELRFNPRETSFFRAWNVWEGGVNDDVLGGGFLLLIGGGWDLVNKKVRKKEPGGTPRWLSVSGSLHTVSLRLWEWNQQKPFWNSIIQQVLPQLQFTPPENKHVLLKKGYHFWRKGSSSSQHHLFMVRVFFRFRGSRCARVDQLPYSSHL